MKTTITVPLKAHASANTLHNSFKLVSGGRFLGGYATFGGIPTGGTPSLNVRLSTGETSDPTYLTAATAVSAADTPTALAANPLTSAQNLDADDQVNVSTTSVGDTPTTANGFAILVFGTPELP